MGVLSANDQRFVEENKNDAYHKSVLASVSRDLELVGSASDGETLDLGCGCGTFVKVSRDSGREAIGIDPRLELIEVAKLKGVGSYVVRGVGEYLPFREASFDPITSLSVLEHVRNAPKVVQESVRVLKVGGAVWMSFPDYSRSFHEKHDGLFWIPLMPKRIAKIYLRMRGRTNTDYLDTIQYVTQGAVREALRSPNVRINDMRRLRANDLRVQVREYCSKRIHSLGMIETMRWRQIISILKRLGSSDVTLCRMCELFCLLRSFRQSVSPVLPSFLDRLADKREMSFG